MRKFMILLLCVRAYAYNERAFMSNTPTDKNFKAKSDMIHNPNSDIDNGPKFPNTENSEDVIWELTDKEYYAMPRLFELDDYKSCVAVGGAYCYGSFELLPIGHNPLFITMQKYSANWVDNFNHTRLHRGVCLTRRCPSLSQQIPKQNLKEWFESCVNTSMISGYNLSATLYNFDYCTQGRESSQPLTTNEKLFAVFLLLLISLTTISTLCDLYFSECTKKGYRLLLCWSVRSSWNSLTSPPASQSLDLRCFDGLRLYCLLLVFTLHVFAGNIISHVFDTKDSEQLHRSMFGLAIANSSFVVQIFFLMSSFLLANNLLKERQRGSARTFIDTMLKRFVRLSPSHFIVIWFASSWWERCGDGPRWTFIRNLASYCRKNWWSDILYINNFVNTDGKCLIHTWFLSTEMQLYIACLVLVLILRNRRNALLILGTFFIAMIIINLGMIYTWRLVPIFGLNTFETLLVLYNDHATMNLMYTSPLGNAVSALAGLFLAYTHHMIQRNSVVGRLVNYRWFRWITVWSASASMVFLTMSPQVLRPGLPDHLPAVIFAALERPIYIALVSIALLGAINKVDSYWRRLFSSGTWIIFARLSYGAYLVHVFIIGIIYMTRQSLPHLDIVHVIMETCGVLVISFLVALPLNLLVELPAQKIYKELRQRKISND